METQSTLTNNTAEGFLTGGELLNHWQGHRKLGRKVLAAFPEKELFEFSIGGMRTYDKLTKEMIGLASAGVNGLVTGNWTTTPEMDLFNAEADITTKEGLLAAWDEVTSQIDSLFPEIPVDTLHDNVKAFGQFDNTVINTILYFIDNDIHHRGQGYVYLRALGIEPPAFWERW